MTKSIRRKRSPKGRRLIHRIKRKKTRSRCRICGTTTHIKTMKNSKIGRHADRPYGGEICHACLRTSIQAIKL